MRYIPILAAVTLLASGIRLAAGDVPVPPRNVVSLDDDWKFHLGDVSDAANPAFDDQAWRHVDVPHDYAVEGTFDPTPPPGSKGHSYAYHASLPTNVAWYRKTISIPAADKGRRIWIEFDGVFNNSHYWLNGHDIGSEYSGYSSFRFDVTDSLNYGGANTLSIRLDPHPDGWWYEGAGIYRHVRLVTVAPVHIAPDGIFVAPSVEDPGDGVHADSTVSVKTELANESGSAIVATLSSEVIDGSGKPVATQRQDLPLAAGANTLLAQSIALAQANLWSLENPYLYRLHSTVRVGDQVVDEVTTPFGVRQIRFDPNQGFFLNGKSVKIQGVNCHQDHAGVGVAMPDRLIEWRLERLKEVGCNAFRLSHNPVAPVTLNDCDRMGILVIAENRHFGDTYADQSAKNTRAVEHRDLSALIKRDRNHPCIILWSLCNEQWTQGTPEGAAIARAMKERVGQLDGTRPVTAAMNGGFDKPDGMANVLDVVGVNYHPDVYNALHRDFPAKPLIATEIASEIGTRGFYDLTPFDGYHGSKDKCYVAAYSVNAGPGGQTVENAWAPVANDPAMSGGFVWSGFDYKGEPRPFMWPCISSHYGIMDLCGFPKDSYYYYQSWWTHDPVLHIFPHWNWPGKEGQDIPVWVQSNCQEVELFLNGISQGKRTVTPLHHVEWKVKYAPGTLTAKGAFNGKPVEASIQTTGAPAAVRLIADRTTLSADNTDLAVIAVEIIDAQGNVVPVANNVVTFTVAGPGKLIGVGNGDPTCHEPDKASWRSAFNGLAQAIVQTSRSSGQITLKAEATGLQPATVVLESH